MIRLTSFLLVILTIFQFIQAQKSSRSLVPFESGDKMGYKDSITNEIVIPAKYNFADWFCKGVAIVDSDGKYSLINKNGDVVFSLNYDGIFPFQEGLAFVMKNKKYGFIDCIGKEVIPLMYDKVEGFGFRSGLACVKLNEKWGFIDKTGKAVVPIQYDRVERNFHEGLTAVNIGGTGNPFHFSGGKWGFVDKSGEEVIPLVYDTVENFKNGAAYVKLNNLTFYINRYGEKIDTIIYGSNDKVGRYKNIRGFNMYYEIYGSGEPLLFIHGNGGSINNFFCQIPYFSKTYKVIAADSRAQGKSADASDSLSYEMMADDFSVLLDSLHIDSCYVIGWSDGGINGLLLAIRHPQKVKKLAVTGANCWPDTTAVDPFVYYSALHENKRMMYLTQDGNEMRNRRKVMHLLTYEPHITSSQLTKIQCPALIIGGDHDVILPKHTMLIAESIPNSYLWIVPNSGHSVPIKYSEQFNNTVNNFFKSAYRKFEGFKRFE
jgi:pimeloyl-ACP methyl ester carboxylesterase